MTLKLDIALDTFGPSDGDTSDYSELFPRPITESNERRNLLPTGSGPNRFIHWLPES